MLLSALSVMNRTLDSGSRDQGSTPWGRINFAQVAELADAQRSGRCMGFHVQVRILPWALNIS